MRKVGPLLYVITGPPASGKTTWLREQRIVGAARRDGKSLVAVVGKGNRPPPPLLSKGAFYLWWMRRGYGQ